LQRRRNIVVVGDNDQAIYRFRGASFGSFKLFLQRFAGWKEGQDSTKLRVLLQENYRSTPNILRVATQAISHNETSADFPQKVLNASKNEGEKVRIVELAGQEEEASWVAGEMERGHTAEGDGDFAVLYRHAPGLAGGRIDTAKSSVRDQQSLDSGSSAGA
jgi:superfamily I DNA/RNA helicase